MILDQLKQYKPYSISPGYNAAQVLYGKYDLDSLIENTTYPVSKTLTKAIEGLVHSKIDTDKIYLYQHEQSLLFQMIYSKPSNLLYGI